MLSSCTNFVEAEKLKPANLQPQPEGDLEIYRRTQLTKIYQLR